MRYIKLPGLLFCATLISTTVTTAAEQSINWNEWSQAPFAQAQSENKIILIDVGMEGCTACRWMDEVTYADPAVVQLVNASFVAIAVDAEARPDIGERYSDWAWPATIFMAPDTTQVLALRGNRLPRNFIPILNELIEKQKTGELTADDLAPYSAAPKPTETDLTIIRNKIRAQLDNNLDEGFGSWGGRRISTTSGALIQHLFFRAHLYNMQALRELGINSAKSYLRAIDPVWGGVFVAAFHQDPNASRKMGKLGAIPEKRIANQAHALNAFAEAYRQTGETIYLQAIKDVDRYLQQWLMDADGTFYTSQEDDPPQLPANMSADDYWILASASERQRYGVPPIDHAVYTDKNGELITAYVNAYEATKNSNYLQAAIRTAQSIIDNRRHEQGWITQARSSQATKNDKRMRSFFAEEKPFLSAQAWFGTALLALYRSSADEEYLRLATEIADAMLAQLYDNKLGGFYSTRADETVSIIGPRKPLEQNAVAARFFYDLWVYTKQKRFQGIPEQTIRAVALPDIIEREGKVVGQLALTLEKLTAAYVEFSVVGTKDDKKAQALFKAGMDAYHPRKLLHYEKAGRYPVRSRPAMYICNPDMCSLPIEDPALVEEKARAFQAAASNG